MPRMTDEEFMFRSDCAEKKRIGHGAMNKVRGGGKYVRLPSDNLSKKERQALNGDVKTYNLGKPMVWKEFLLMPDDMKVRYIEIIRSKFPDIPNSEIALMFGTAKSNICRVFKELGIKTYQKHGKNPFLDNHEKYNEWLMWSGTGDKHVEKPKEPDIIDKIPGIVETAMENEEKLMPEQHVVSIEPEDQMCEVPVWEDRTTLPAPCSGEISWVGNAKQIFEMLTPLIGSGEVKLKVSWEVCA